MTQENDIGYVALAELRTRGIRLLAVCGWVSIGVMIAVNAFIDVYQGALGISLAIAVTALPTLVAKQRRHDPQARYVVATMAAVHPAIFVYLMKGHPWQMDMHMFFFVALAGLTALCDWRPIALAAALIAVHHLLLEYVAPTWVFTGTGNIDRVLIHALAVVLQFAILRHVTMRLGALVVEHGAALAESRMLADEATAARDTAEAAQQNAEAALFTARASDRLAAEERGARQRAEQAAAGARRDELLAIAAEFEQSVSAVVEGVGAAAEQLEGSSRKLSEMARDAGRQAREVAAIAADASASSQEVARGIAVLARAIDSISVNVEAQTDLATRVGDNAAATDAALLALGERTSDIGAFVEVIQGIAARTNRLALNATIEAARAGDAGRGFAVVAGEVKMLAGQAAGATGQIGTLIAGVRTRAEMAGGSLRDVSSAVGDMTSAADAIASAIVEQRETASRIERSADRSAAGADDTAARIDRMAKAAGAAGVLSSHVRDAATDLAHSAVALRETTDRFVAHLRAA